MKLHKKSITAAIIGICLLLFLAWQPDKPLESLAPHWAGPPSQWISLDIPATRESPATAIDIHYRDEGPKSDLTPIILLHGTGSSLHTWDGWASQLKATRRVIRLDLPGFGLTGGFKDGNYSMLRYSATLSVLGDRLQLSPVVVAGNSLGGLIAWQYAVNEPQRVRKLVLVDATGYALSLGNMPIAFVLAQLPVIKNTVPYSLPRYVIESSLRNVYADQGKITPDLVDRYFDLALRTGNRAALVQQFAYRRDTDMDGQTAPRIKQITQPTFILWGSEDKLVPAEHAMWFKRDIPHAQVAALPALGHVPIEEDPVASPRTVWDFLQ